MAQEAAWNQTKPLACPGVPRSPSAAPSNWRSRILQAVAVYDEIAGQAEADAVAARFLLVALASISTSKVRENLSTDLDFATFACTAAGA